MTAGRTCGGSAVGTPSSRRATSRIASNIARASAEFARIASSSARSLSVASPSMARWINSNVRSSSHMALSLERLPQQLAGGEQARLHHLLGNVEHVGHLAIGEVKEVPQDQYGPIVFIEGLDALLEVIAPLSLLVVLRGIGAQILEAIAQRLRRPARLQMIDRLIDGGAIDPTEEPPVRVVCVEMLERFHKHLLTDFPRVF